MKDHSTHDWVYTKMSGCSRWFGGELPSLIIGFEIQFDKRRKIGVDGRIGARCAGALHYRVFLQTAIEKGMGEEAKREERRRWVWWSRSMHLPPPPMLIELFIEETKEAASSEKHERVSDGMNREACGVIYVCVSTPVRLDVFETRRKCLWKSLWKQLC